MSTTLFDALKKDINERQDELSSVQAALESAAASASRISKLIKIAVILLGAFAATREVADRLYPPDVSPRAHWWVIGLYTFFGLAITVLGSIAATFRYESRAAELNVLAAECNSHLLNIDCQLPKEGDTAPLAEQIGAAHKLILLQNEKISEIQGKAAKLGLSVNRRVRKLKTNGEQRL